MLFKHAIALHSTLFTHVVVTITSAGMAKDMDVQRLLRVVVGLRRAVPQGSVESMQAISLTTEGSVGQTRGVHSGGRDAQARERIARSLEALRDTESKREKHRPYVWPAVQKGQTSQQANRLALASVQRAKRGHLFQETMKATLPLQPTEMKKFNVLNLDECTDQQPMSHKEAAVRPHSIQTGRVVDENSEPIDWGWEGAQQTIYSQTELSSSRALRAWCKYDDLIETALDNASADGRRGRWKTGVKAWFAFCEGVMGVPAARPMDPLTTPLWEKLEDEWLAMRFVCALVQERGVSPQSAAVYFSSVQGWHAREHGVKLAGGMKLDRLPQMLKGLRRIVGDQPRRVRRGVAPQQLRRAMDKLLDPRDPKHANVRAALAVAFQGLLRASEFTDQAHNTTRETLMRGDLVELSAKRLVIMMQPCKNMLHLGGKTCPLVIGAGGLHIDAVREVNNMLQVDSTDERMRGATPLFRDPTTGRPLQYQEINEWVKALMASVGEPEAQFSSHSLRIGGATALFAQGANETVIRTMGRWSSDMYRLYVRACFEQCCEWTAAAGSAQVSDLSGEFDEVDDY